MYITAHPHAGEAIGGNKETVIYLDETTRTRDTAFFLAIRLWNILLGAIPIADITPIYRQSGRTPSNEELQRRTSGIT